jgi:hypothetical protein
MLLERRPQADTSYPFCRAQSRTACTWSRPYAGGFTTRCDRRGFCGATRVPCSTNFASFSRSRVAVAALRSISKFVPSRLSRTFSTSSVRADEEVVPTEWSQLVIMENAERLLTWARWP